MLLQQAQDGDHEAFRTLMENHERLVFRLVLRMLGCDPHTAADVTQEVFLRAFRSIRAFDGRALFRTWLHKITMNLCITEHRKRKALKRDRKTLSLDGVATDVDRPSLDPVAAEPGPLEKVHHQDIGEAVAAAVQKLPDEFRQCVLLRDMNGMSYEEIAEILDLVPGTVRSRIHRGRVLLQQKLSEFRP